MADVELQMQQMKVQQQAGGDGAGGEAAGQHSNLSAASLRVRFCCCAFRNLGACSLMFSASVSSRWCM
jgi:hypothetical protein